MIKIRTFGWYWGYVSGFVSAAIAAGVAGAAFITYWYEKNKKEN